MNFDFSVVFDEAQFAKFVHEKAHARSGRADHLRQCPLAKRPGDRLWRAFLAEICKEEEKAGGAPFAGIEQLVDQVRFNATAPRQQVRHEQLRKPLLIVNGCDHGRLLYASDQAFIECPRRCDVEWMAVQTSFAQELTWSQNCNHRFLALLGNDGELDLAFLNVKNRVRDLSLRENDLILPEFGDRFPLAHGG